MVFLRLPYQPFILLFYIGITYWVAEFSAIKCGWKGDYFTITEEKDLLSGSKKSKKGCLPFLAKTV